MRQWLQAKIKVGESRGLHSEKGLVGSRKIWAIAPPSPFLTFVLAWRWFLKKKKTVREKST